MLDTFRNASAELRTRDDRGAQDWVGRGQAGSDNEGGANVRLQDAVNQPGACYVAEGHDREKHHQERSGVAANVEFRKFNPNREALDANYDSCEFLCDPNLFLVQHRYIELLLFCHCAPNEHTCHQIPMILGQ